VKEQKILMLGVDAGEGCFFCFFCFFASLFLFRSVKHERAERVEGG